MEGKQSSLYFPRFSTTKLRKGEAVPGPGFVQWVVMGGPGDEQHRSVARWIQRVDTCIRGK